MSATSNFKLTYSTMFDPPAEVHQRFDQALVKIKVDLGREHGMLIAGKERSNKDKFELRNPINRDWLLGVFQQGGAGEIDGFFSRIEAGVIYANRPQGATTGAWPGYQSFGGWKGSGTTGKAIGSFYYVQQYMCEQSQTVVD